MTEAPQYRHAHELVTRLADAMRQNQLALWSGREPRDQYDPSRPRFYAWQEEFMAAGRHHRQRCLMCANRVGKSATVSAEVAMHLTGRYPSWWRGHRFDGPVSVWVGAETNEATRDTTQKALLGMPFQWGTGWLPRDALHPDGPSMRQCGITGVVESIRVQHQQGGWSYVAFKSYEQDRAKWQGTAQDIVWFDEEPPHDIFTEGITRTADTAGITVLSFTPLKGCGDVVMSFLEPREGSGAYVKTATWDEALHLDQESKAQLLATYPEHERDARTKGVPMMGHGLVYKVGDDKIMCDPFGLPDHYRRICGIDFGINHPFGAVWLAHDADSDTVYLYDEHRVSDQTPSQHAVALVNRGRWIPVAWPHDGGNREKGSGETLADQYREQRVNLLGMSARYRDDGGGGGQQTEPVIQDILERMRSGRFKVFSTCRQWLSEKRLYHRNDRGVIVRERDDLISACHYAVMMLRHAVSPIEHGGSRQRRSDGVGGEAYDPLAHYRVQQTGSRGIASSVLDRL